MYRHRVIVQHITPLKSFGFRPVAVRHRRPRHFPPTSNPSTRYSAHRCRSPTPVRQGIRDGPTEIGFALDRKVKLVLPSKPNRAKSRRPASLRELAAPPIRRKRVGRSAFLEPENASPARPGGEAGGETIG
jgi:hypothetical protein